jgi:hypothetical protein
MTFQLQASFNVKIPTQTWSIKSLLSNKTIKKRKLCHGSQCKRGRERVSLIPFPFKGASEYFISRERERKKVYNSSTAQHSIECRKIPSHCDEYTLSCVTTTLLRGDMCVYTCWMWFCNPICSSLLLHAVARDWTHSMGPFWSSQSSGKMARTKEMCTRDGRRTEITMLECSSELCKHLLNEKFYLLRSPTVENVCNWFELMETEGKVGFGILFYVEF